MHQPTPEQKAFLKLRLPENYAPVKQDVDALKQWLADAANASAASNPAESRKLLIGLEDPEQNTPVARLQEIVQRCCEAVVLDRNNAAAHFMLARAITELGRFDEDTYHGQALRDASDFAENAKQLAPKVGKAWRAGIEILIRQGRHDIAYEQLGELQKLGIAPGTHATLMALWHERQGHWAEAAQYYEKAVTYATNNARRSELYTLEALAWINAGKKSDADRALMLGLLEGGEQPWIAHNWSVLKNELGNSWAAVELNRRALMWDPGFEAAQEFRDYLQNAFTQLKRPWPGAQMLQEEQLRGIALPGCDTEIMVKNKLQPWSPPRRGERAKATRTFRTGLEEV
jgi:tetratricopeptide (TPR) repeat protein